MNTFRFRYFAAMARIGMGALLAGFVPVMAQSLPPLGTAATFAVLGGSGVSNTGSTIIVGDVGVSPGSAIIGFPPGTVTGGTIHSSDAVALQAQSDLTTAYNDAAGQACNTDLTGTDLGGLTLTPGVYCFSTSAQLTGTLALDAQGNPSAVFIFQIGSTLTTASGASVVMINGGSRCNVVWQVGASATLGTTTLFAGNILALTSITLTTGASASGRVLARNGAVTLDTNNVTVCAFACAPIVVTPATLPNGTVGLSYAQTISASGGTAPYSFSVTGGALPPGFTLASSGASTALLAGTPTSPGSFTFTISAMDANACVGTLTYTVVINAFVISSVVTAAPTLSQWAYILLGALLAAAGFLRLPASRRKRG
jgi:hypothetical protein